MCMMQAKPDNPHRLAPDDPQAGGLQLRKKRGQLLTREQLKAQKVRPNHTRCCVPVTLLRLLFVKRRPVNIPQAVTGTVKLGHLAHCNKDQYSH